MKTEEYYDAVVEKYIKNFFDDFSDAEELDRFLALLPVGSRILDVGCGPGQYSGYFIQRGFLVEGIDLAPKMIDAAKRLVPSANFQVMDMRNLAFQDGSFEGVILAYSFLHLAKTDAKPTLVELNRVLKTHGVGSLMLKEGDGEVYMNSRSLPGAKVFVALWRADEISAVLTSSGFEITSFRRDLPKNPAEYQFPKLQFLIQKATSY